ncbi:alkane hydroxylase MAH1-like [Hordeum vulgare subsp. vulgare]|uniref:alkane hydroxylase MAH1-like n=1 Tax=Hordeum vulgare subsp. vulgare TaxID=112509 RepID=UPI00162E717B|nr:alkane hydroxylase MAH1-like [Hordeum vulgare subsp. vulgare]
MDVVSWVRGFLGENTEIMASLACFLLLFLWFRRWDGLPTSWPVIGTLPALCVNTGRMHEWMTDFLRGAGMTYVLGGSWGTPVDVIVTADPANVAHVFTANFGNYPKGEVYARVFSVLGDGILKAEGEWWAFQRRKAQALLSDARFLAAVAASTARKLDEGLVPLLDGLAASGATVDLQDVLMRLSFDLTTMSVFGIDRGCLAADFPHVPFAAAMDEAEEMVVYRYITPVPWLKLQRYLKIGHGQRMSEARRVIDASIAELISLRRERAANVTGEAGTDLLALYMACQAEVGKVGADFDRFLRDTTLTLMLAGRDTTSSTLTWFFWLLHKHPDVEAKILAELREHPPGAGHHRTTTELRCLVYLHAALSESLRLYPPTPFQHKAAARPDTLPSGATVRQSQIVVVSFYSMGRMEAVWGKDCLEFRPERWLTAAGRFRHEPSHKFVAFNVGPRTCLGRDLAFSQMKAVIAAVLPQFRLEVAAGFAARPKPKLSVILYMKDGLVVTVHKRQEDRSSAATYISS